MIPKRERDIRIYFGVIFGPQAGIIIHQRLSLELARTTRRFL
jgi:hypothetical protein